MPIFLFDGAMEGNNFQLLEFVLLLEHVDAVLVLDVGPVGLEAIMASIDYVVTSFKSLILTGGCHS